MGRWLVPLQPTNSLFYNHLHFILFVSTLFGSLGNYEFTASMGFLIMDLVRKLTRLADDPIPNTI